jgi:topoisomerase-4 subunit B
MLFFPIDPFPLACHAGRGFSGGMSKAYTEDSIRTLDWHEHIRLRPGMYIGKLGDGSAPDDGIYVLLKEVIDNAIDEFTMGYGKRIEVTIDPQDRRVTVRDYGRGIPLGKLVDAVSKINTGAKYDTETFQKAVGLNGVGIKAVNALSSSFKVAAFREGESRLVEFERGVLRKDGKITSTTERNGTLVTFVPDEQQFPRFRWNLEFVETMLRNYAYLARGLTLSLNGKIFKSERGLHDFLTDHLDGEPVYPVVHLQGDDIEIAFTHTSHYGEDIASFVNGQNTVQGGTHLAAFREAFVKVVRDFYKKDFVADDVRSGIVGAISLRVQEPIFESQTKVKLGSQDMAPGGPTIRQFISQFLSKELDNLLHKTPEVANGLKAKIEQSERERKELAGIKELARDRARKASLHNRKLRDCRAHLGTKDKHAGESTLFIVEGDSAAGSLTACRDVNTQAVFALKGKPLNTYGLTKRVIYENEEFNLLQAALNIEDGLEGLRYQRIVVATDADEDGKHIRLLILAFFLKFFPDLIRGGHLFVLQTPLFRVRNKSKTLYCYNDEEKQEAIAELGGSPEITRFKGLGEISPSEFKAFIGPDIRLEHVSMNHLHNSEELLAFYLGKNTPDRQGFIIDNLRIEIDPVAA